MMDVKRRITKDYFNIARKQYAPLINKLSFYIGLNDSHIEELKSYADEELLKCMICYNKSSSFMTFIYYRLNGVFRHSRDKEYRFRKISCMPIKDMVNLSVYKEDNDCNMIVKECLECLDDKENDVIIQLFMNNKTMREISDERGIVASTVFHIKERAIKKMQVKCRV